MAFISRSTTASTGPLADTAAVPYGEWRERAVTAVTASLAVLIVATIAVLMGMA